MTPREDTPICRRGHRSTEADYCSECGTRIGGAPGELASPEARGSFAGEICPDCATLREQPEIAFCEVCGFNFQTGKRGEIPMPPEAAAAGITASNSPASRPDALAAAPSAVAPAIDDPVQDVESTPETTETALSWSLAVEVDPALGEARSPAPPEGFQPFVVTLTQPVSLVGRLDPVRGIFPEIALTHDEAVSRRHALLQWSREQGTLQLRDIGASNGTRLNGTDLAAMTDHPLQAGDEITLGHWSRLRVQRP